MIYFLVVSTLLGWGVAGIFDKKAVESSCPKSVLVLFHLFSIPMAIALLIALPFIYGEWQLTSGVIFWEGLNGVASVIAMLAYFWAMSKAQASYVLGITAGYPIVGQLLAVPLCGEHFSSTGLLGAALVSGGVFLIGLTPAMEEGKKLDAKTKVLLIIAIAVPTILWGVLGIFEKNALQFGRPLEAYLALSFWKSGLALVLLAAFTAVGSKIALGNRAAWKFSWASASLVGLGNIASVFALGMTNASYVIVMTAGYPLVMYICAVLFLKEKLLPMRLAGMLLVIVGCVFADFARS